MEERVAADCSSNECLLDRRSVLSLGSTAVLASVLGGSIVNGTLGDETTAGESTDPTIGAHYYTWYGRGDHVNWVTETPEDPTFGSYDSRDPAVIDQHLEWCRQYGIDWLSMSWWGENSPEDVTIRDHITNRSLTDVEFSIFYETPGMLTAADDGTYNLDESRNRDQLVGDVEYLADTYFSDAQYRRIDGRPVLYLYIAREFRGDVGAVFDAMRAASPDGLYIIADLIRFGPPLESDGPLIEAADAVTSYNMYSPKSDINDNFVGRATDVYDQWVDPLRNGNTEFIPVVIPGYDDTELEHVSRDNPVLEASPALFREFCRGARPYVTDGANSLFITSFNEWYENTQIEPSRTFGTAYLEVLAQEFDASQTTTDGETTEIALRFDRTVSEAELADGIENPRELAIRAFALDVLDRAENVLASYDIGIEGSEPGFGAGVYQPEQLPDAGNTDDSWRWFGGPEARATIYLDSSLEDAESLVLRSGSVEGAIQVSVRRDGTPTDSVTVDGRTPADYRLDVPKPTSGDLLADTQDATAIEPTAATLNGSVDDLGGVDAATWYFQWREDGAETWNTTGNRSRSSTGSVSATVSDLSSSTRYEYQLVVETATGTTETGRTVQFTTANDGIAPSIDRYEVTTVRSTNPHLDITADWSVSDGEGNLDTVILQVFDSSGSLADAKTTELSGHEASTSGTKGITVKHVDDTAFDVVLTVVDSYGNSSRRTETVSK